MIYLEYALRSSVIIALGAGAVWLLRGHSAARRHAVWLLTLVALLLLPAVRNWAPGWEQTAPVRTWPAPLRTVIQVTAGAEAPLPGGGKSTLRDIWLVGVAALLARIVAGQMAARRLVHDAEPFRGDALVSDGLSVPMVFGLRRPVIVLPTAARQWPAGQLASVLAHERMHIARRDNWWQLLSQVTAALYWPQPLVWWVVSALHNECEQACDDGVLVAGTPASEYAGYLVTIGRTLSTSRIPAGGIAMTRTSQLQRRVMALLDPSARRQQAGRGFVTCAGLAAGVVLAPASVQTPLLAQGRFAGVVRDSSSAVIPKARMELKSSDETMHEVVYSSPAGEFTIPNVPDGAYTLTVAAPGFARLTVTGLKYEAASAKPFDLTLNVGMLQERLQVTGESSTRPATTAAAAPPSRIRVGGNVQAAKLVSQVRPIYPATAKADAVEGTVLLRAVIGRDGSVVTLEQVNRTVDARLLESARDAVKQWRYSPTLLNGNPVEVITVVEVNFTLAP